MLQLHIKEIYPIQPYLSPFCPAVNPSHIHQRIDAAQESMNIYREIGISETSKL